jgi:hypothetical protein
MRLKLHLSGKRVGRRFTWLEQEKAFRLGGFGSSAFERQEGACEAAALPWLLR